MSRLPVLRQRFVRYHSSLISPRISPDQSAWDIFAAVALMRPPIIAPPMNAIEKRFQNVLLKKEFENSLRCDFELRELRDERLLKEREKIKKGQEGVNLKEDLGILASVDEEKWRNEADRIRKQYSIGDISKYSKVDDRSLQRKIDEHLVLIVQQKFARKDGYHSPWQLPQLQNQPGESLKQTSERCFKEFFSGEIAHMKGLSNAPFSMYKYGYPIPLRQRLKKSSQGAVVFFFKALYTERIALRINQVEIADYKWVDAIEFVASVRHTPSYLGALSTLFPSHCLSKNYFENRESTGSEKRKQAKVEIQAHV